MRNIKGPDGTAGASGDGKGKGPESNVTKVKDEKNGWYVVTTTNADGTTTITYQDENGKDIKPNSVMSKQDSGGTSGASGDDGTSGGKGNIGGMLNGGVAMNQGYGFGGQFSNYNAGFTIDSNEFAKSSMKLGGFAALTSLLSFGTGGMFSNIFGNIMSSFMNAVNFDFSKMNFNVGGAQATTTNPIAGDVSGNADSAAGIETESATNSAVVQDSLNVGESERTTTDEPVDEVAATVVEHNAKAKAKTKVQIELDKKLEEAKKAGVSIETGKTYTIEQLDKMIATKKTETQKANEQKRNASMQADLAKSVKDGTIYKKDYSISDLTAYLDSHSDEIDYQTTKDKNGNIVIGFKKKQANGNSLVDSTLLTFDKNGRMLKVAKNGGTYSISRDANGKRTSMAKKATHGAYADNNRDEEWIYSSTGSIKTYRQHYSKPDWTTVKDHTTVKRTYNLQLKSKAQPMVKLPKFSASTPGYNSKNQSIAVADNVWKQEKNGNVIKTNKKTGEVLTYSKEGKLIKQYIPKSGIIRDYGANGIYNEHYNEDWKK